jgi:energy-coupling factor transporter ATP-binding protein EcfA2
MATVEHRGEAVSAAPSRHANPFATCWTRPGAMTFQFDDGQSAQALVEKLAAQRWRGAIVGPHGCGKSTLLQSLKPAFRPAGMRIHSIAIRDGQRRLPLEFLSSITRQADNTRAIAIVDGYEQLGWLERTRLSRTCRLADCGLLVTSHRPTWISMLVRVAPTEQLVQRLVVKLASRVSTKVTSEDVAASYARHGSNVREMFFDLYDRHEALRRSQRRSGDSAAALSRP